MDTAQLLEDTLYFLALINPVSKIFFLTSNASTCTRKELVSISIRSTIVAFILLGVLTAAGNFLLVKVFHVEIYSLSVAGGIILFIIGLTAVRQGKFFEDSKEMKSISEACVVPLAAPLIAGPGTMAAAISYASMHGVISTLICISMALLINLFFMLLSFEIGKNLEKVHATGPIIRITGLIVTAVAMQMIFSGAATWITKTL